MVRATTKTPKISAAYLDAVLQAVKLPAGIAHLDTGLQSEGEGNK